MAEPYLVQMVKEGREQSGRLTGYTLAELFGEAVTVAAEGSRLTENARVIGGILFTEVVIEKIPARAGGYRAAGKLVLPQGWEYYDSYAEGISDFSGNAVCTQTTQGWRVDFELTAPLAKRSSFLLSLKGHWQGQGGETQSSEAYAELVYQVRLDAVGELKLHHRLLRGNAWTYYADFEPPLRPSSVAGFIGSLVGIQDITNIVKIPEGMPGLDFLAISGLRFMLSPARTLRGIEILLTVGEAWKPSVPYFKAKELGISLYFSIPAGGVERATCSGGVFGTFLMQITSDFRLRLDLWGYIPELAIEGELLAEQDKKETVLLGDVLSSYGMPQADVGKLTVAGARYIASIPGRSFDLEFFIDSREMLSFSILGLTIAITEISGQISYDPAAFALMLSGEIQIGRTNPFTLGLTFDYDCKEESGWHFKAELIAGEASIAAVLSELFRLDALREDPVFDLKLTDFMAEFYSNGRGPFTVRAALEQPWSTRLLGVNLVLFGSVDLTKAVTEEMTGTLMAGFKLNAFQIRVFYELVKETRYRFQIWYGDAYLEARYEKRNEHELLILGLKGMTLYGLVNTFVHMVNPNADFKLSAPWDILDRIRLDDFSLEFDMQERTVSMLYTAELNLLGLVEIRQIGIRYSRKETAKVEFILVGSVLEQEYTSQDPMTWDAIDDNPPDIGGTDAAIITLDYLGMGQHFGTEELLAAKNITEAVKALKGAITPIGAGERPVLSYAESVNWLFGVDMTYRGMLRLQLALNDPSLYGILITVKNGEDSALSQLAGLSLQLLYRKITDDIGMFSAELTVPDRFKVLDFGALRITLGKFYLELYTNGNFYLDLGFPSRQDFSSSFVVEAGYYTGRGGFYFGILNQETCAQVPAIVNGRFDPVIAIGVGLSLGIGRSFDFSVVKGAVSLEFFAIFEGIFALYTPSDASQKKDFYYAAKAVAGIYGRLFLSVDFVVISVSANAEVKAYVSVALEAYQPILFAVDLDLKVGASIKILFVKVSFSFHFSMHMDFSIGEAQKTPWKLADGQERRRRTGGYAPYRMRALVESAGQKETGKLRREMRYSGEKVDIEVRILPLYTAKQPSLEPCAAFLLLVGQEAGFAQIIKIAEEWVAGHLSETVSLAALEQLSDRLRGETGEFVSYFKERTRLVLAPVPTERADDAEEDGVFFPAVPGLIFRWLTYGKEGEIIGDETVSFADEPMVDEAYMEMLKEYFARLNPAPQTDTSMYSDAGTEAQGSVLGRYGTDERAALAEVLLEDYLAVILQAVTKEAQEHIRAVHLNTAGKTLRELSESFRKVHVLLRKMHGDTWESAAAALGMPVAALRYGNRMRGEIAETDDGAEQWFSVGVTPHSILLDNPAWKFASDTITVDGTEYETAGQSVEQLMRQNGISLDALVEAIQDERAVLTEDVIVVRNAPVLEREEVCGILHSDETAKQAAGMVSRFFLQGLRLPCPSADIARQRNASFFKSKENWAGLYEIMGQQKKLLHEEGTAEDFLRHRLTVTVAAGYESWIETGENFELTISNEEIDSCAPSVLFTPVFKQPLQEIAPYVLEKRQHPFEEYRLYLGEDTRKSILVFTKEFMRIADGHLSDYTWNVDSLLTGFGRTMGRNIAGQEREGNLGLLLALTLQRTSEELPVYEITVTGKGSSRALDAMRKEDVACLELLYEPSAVEGMEDGLYRLPLTEEKTRLVMTDLSRETKSSPNALFNLDKEVVYIADMSEPNAFLTLLWQLSVTNCGGYYLCLEDAEILKPSLFSSSGEGKLWLLATAWEAEAGCNCVIHDREVGADEYAWLSVKEEKSKEHPDEYAVKSLLNPGSAGFSAALAQPKNPEEDKQDAVRNLYSIINYRIHGEGYEDCETGMPLLPKEPGDDATVWEYSQSVPLDRFLLSGSENPYDNVGMAAQIELEFRDVLGNAVCETNDTDSCNSGADDGGSRPWGNAWNYSLEITPEYNDALLAIHQSGAVSVGYMVREGQLVLAVAPSLQTAMEKKKRNEIRNALKKSTYQIQAAGTSLYLESTLLAKKISLPCETILELYRQIQNWLLWVDTLAPALCTSQTLGDAVTDYTLTPEELLDGNLDVKLSQLFGEQELFVPVIKTFYSGASLAVLMPEVGWERNKEAALHAGTDVIISEEAGRDYTVSADGRTFALAASAIGCQVSSLVEDNRDKKGILLEHYEFTFQGYEMEVGSENGVTASLDDVCAAFLQFFEVNVTPMELVAEETDGILAEGAALSYRRLTAAHGETLSRNHMGCTAERLWNYNRATKDLFENGTAVWCSTKTIAAEDAGSLREMCEVYGITTRQFYDANKEIKLQEPSTLALTSCIAFPETAYTSSFTLEENGGAGYRMAWVCSHYHCEEGLWFYRRMQHIIIEGTQIHAPEGTVTVSRFDTIESVDRKLKALGADSEALLMEAQIVRDGITLPLLPQGKRYRENIDTSWIRKRTDILLKLDVELHLYRASDRKENPPEEIYHAWTPVLPGTGDGQASMEEFVQGLEETMPFAYVVQGETEQKTQDGLYLWIAKGDGGKGITNIAFAPSCYYDKEIKTPAVYALAPITTNPVNRENVAVAPLTEDGALGEEIPQNFAGIDPERWAVIFLQDIEGMFAPQMVEKTFRHDCEALLERLLEEKELLAKKIPERLCHVLQPLDDVGETGMDEAKKVVVEQLRGSLSRAYGKNVLLQYPGKVETGAVADKRYRLAGSISMDGFTEPVHLKAGKVELMNEDAYLHVFAEAERLRNASFPLKAAEYQIRELERIWQQEGEIYEQSDWFSLLRPIDQKSGGDNVKIDLSCGLKVPVPLRFYPMQPVLKNQAITTKQPEEIKDISELLRYHYHVTLNHEMAGQDMIYVTVVFNEKPAFCLKNARKDVFDCLAQYIGVREELLGLLHEGGDKFAKAYETFVELVHETAEYWEDFEEKNAVMRLEERTYDCHFRTWYMENELQIELFAKEEQIPVIHYVLPDGTEQKMEAKRTAEGGRYRMSGVSDEELSATITLRLTLEELDIFAYQSVYAKSYVTRNEAISDSLHPVNERFLYRTDETAFAHPLQALVSCEKDVRVVIPAEYLNGSSFEERALRYLFEEVFEMGQRDAQISCQISYGYQMSLAAGANVELPICLQPRTVYTDAWLVHLAEHIKRWRERHNPPARGRYLRIEITVFSTELQDEGIPVVKLGGIRVDEVK